MKLLDHLKSDRARQKEKKPLPETVFTAVAAIVQKFALTSVPGDESAGDAPTGTPPSARLSLFPLLSPAQFRLTQEIIARFGNPYLVYARSPADIRISLLLHQTDPELPPVTLQRYSLGQLLALKREPAEQLNPDGLESGPNNDFS